MLLQTLSVKVDASAKKVFETLSDINQIPSWNSQTSEIEIITEGKVRKGFEFKAGDGKRMYSYRVSEYKPNTVFQFEEEGGVGFVGTINIKSLKTGTKIEFIQEADDSLFFKVFKPIVLQMLKKYNKRDIALLEELFSK